MTKLCKIENCTNPSRTHDMCHKHYWRERKYGTPYFCKSHRRSTNERQEIVEENLVAYVFLPGGFRAIIDTADVPRVEEYKWYLQVGYAFSNKLKLLLHQHLIGKAPKGYHIDHINRNRLDNRRQNLRIVSPGDNYRNSDRWELAKGYSWYAPTKKFHCRMTVAGKYIDLGYATTEEQANGMVAEAKLKYFGTRRDD